MILLKEKAENLLSDQIQAPLYRLSVVAYETSFPILLAEGVVTEEEIKIKENMAWVRITKANSETTYISKPKVLMDL